ncbi:MAG TPA: hypothetical protein VEV83_02795 [Parafilimonas sp.]|nr:hypothetical protein [Parafilimonas sp.]
MLYACSYGVWWFPTKLSGAKGDAVSKEPRADLLDDTDFFSNKQINGSNVRL